MRHKYRNERLKSYLGDVRDQASLSAACEVVDYLLHAAAIKQVPSCEHYPMEATRTSAFGTDNVLTDSLLGKTAPP